MEKKKIKLYLILIFALFVFVLYFSLKDNYMAIIEALTKVNILYLLLGIVLVFLSKYFLGLTLYYLAQKEKKDTSLKKMVKIREINTYKNLRTDRINEKEA